MISLTFGALMLSSFLLLQVVTSKAAAAPRQNANSVSPGEFLIDPPTLINLGFEWFIEGDANHNAIVEVSYRKKGESQWKPALPLLRLQNEEIYQGDRLDLVAPNMFAGSILDLEPGTEYDARFVMSDPDGVRGESQKIVTVRTRPEPQPSSGGQIYHVYPHGYKGTKIQPAFEGLLCAYYLTCSGTDWATASRPRVKPGDTILVHAGLYKYDRYIYTNDLSISTVPFDGTYYLTASGTAEKPIAIKAAGDGEAIFDGNGAFNLFNVKAANYTYFEGLTIRNTEIAIWAGTQFIEGSKGLTVKHCRFEEIGMGVYTNYSGSKDFYIADNYFIGRNDPKHLIAWTGNFWAQFAGVDGQVFPPKMASYIAVKVYGSGHVMAYNYVANFHDGIDTETYGNPDGSAAIDGPKYPPKEYWDRRPVSIDYYNNYMTNFHDDAFEIDGSMHNVRVMRNLMINNASQPFCNQPALGGPGLLDWEYLFQLAGRLCPLRWRVGNPLLQQHHLWRGVRRNDVEHSFPQQSDSGAERNRGLAAAVTARPPSYSALRLIPITRPRITTASVRMRMPLTPSSGIRRHGTSPLITPHVATTLRSKLGDIRRSRSIKKRRSRTRTACWLATMPSSTCRISMATTSRPSRNYMMRKTSTSD